MMKIAIKLYMAKNIERDIMRHSGIYSEISSKRHIRIYTREVS